MRRSTSSTLEKFFPHWDKCNHIHLVGVGGAGMSSLALILLNHGYMVSGSDLNASPNTEMLSEKGVRIFIGHHPTHIHNAHIVVYSAAVPHENSELNEAIRREIPIISRIDMIAEIMKRKYGISVSGTHGKTTTTSMIGTILEDAQLSSTLLVGGKLRSAGLIDHRSPDYVVAEACEAFGDFLHLPSIITIITNIDDDHLDYYKSLTAIQKAFIQFANQVPFYGQCILCLDDRSVREILPKIQVPTVTYGVHATSDILAKNVELKALGSEFDVYYQKSKLGHIQLNVPGLFNVQNALASIGVAIKLNLKFARVQRALKKFSGVERRFQILGMFQGAPVIDDYAHHPTAIVATLQAAKKFSGNRKIICVFQPHLFSRTYLLRNKFSKAFLNADEVILLPIYASRESPSNRISSTILMSGIRRSGQSKVELFENFLEVQKYLTSRITHNHVLVLIGAGDIWKLGKSLIEAHGEHRS
jgi:UDP-N-acetylmuramate--alanine ligase